MEVAPTRSRPVRHVFTGLVVDDDTLFTAGLADRFRAEGWRLLVAATEEEAQGAGRYHAVDLVVASSRLPDASGPELCARLRATWRTPIVLLVDGEPPDALPALLDRGADACAKRSGDLGLLVALVRAVARRSPGPPATTA